MEKRDINIKRMSSVVGLDLSYLFANGFWITLRYGVVAVLGLLFTIGFARLGSRELFGQYQFVLSLAALFSVLSLPGLNTAALRSISVGGSISVVRQTIRWSFFSSLLAFPGIIGYGVYRHFFLHDLSFDMMMALVASAALFPFFYAPNTWYAAYEGRTLFMPVAIRTILSTGFVVGILLVSLLFHANLLFLVIMYFGINALFSWYFSSEIFRREKAEDALGVKKGDVDIRYGFAVTLQKFAYGLSENVPPLLISFFFGFGFLAIFQIASFFINTVSGLLTALSSMYLPKLFSGEKLEHKKIILQNVIVGLFSYAALAFLLRTVFLLFYGSGYSESQTLAWILAPLIIISPLRIYLLNFFTARGSSVFIVTSFIAANLLGASLFFCIKGAYPIFGVAAYIYSLHISTLLFFLAKYAYFLCGKKSFVC